jgi:SAM-dependent methyltransferase
MCEPDPTTIPKTFDAYAEVYEEKFNRNPLGIYQRERVQVEIAPYLTPGKRVLDAGCGPGSDFAFYQSRNLMIDAIDISPRMAELVREKARYLKIKTRIFNTSLEDFQPDTAYDVILLNFGVINVFGNLSPILRKLKSMLTAKGILVVVSMPPFHLFSIAELLGKLRFRAAAQRVFQKKALLKNGFTFFYYRKTDFLPHFQLLKKIHLCPLLPNPDQYQRHEWMQKITNLLMGIDRRIASVLPDIFGGDHVCYILNK